MNKIRLLIVLVSCSVIFSCSQSPHKPAPVVTLDMTIEQPTSVFEQQTYTIQPGDTLFAIAWYSGNDYRDLAEYNDLKPPYTIRVGDSIRLTPPPQDNPAQSGHTSTVKQQKAVDRSKEQAYGESEKVVNEQDVSAVNVPQSKPRKGFPGKVKQWVWPAKGDIVGTFDSRESGNKGVDIRNQKGTPIVAAADGKVVYTGEALRGYGRLIIIKHTDTFLSAYAHNDRILVAEQQWVKAGQEIGKMGSSGTDSVMLHFEVRYRGKSLDPMRYLPRR